MERFSGGDGFVHFVFANGDDRYFLPSLVSMDLDGYLYHLLRQRGYQGIHFLRGLDEEYLWKIYDEDTRRSYLKYTKKSKGLFGLFGGPEEDPQARAYVPGTADATLERMTNLIRKERKQAFVVLLDTFWDLAGRARPEMLVDFAQAGQRHLAQKGGILVLLAPVNAAGSLPYLQDKQGPLYAGWGSEEGCLCPELRRILSSEKNEKFYQQMARELGPRCQFFNDYSREQLTLLAKYFCLVRRNDWDGSRRAFEDLGDFLYCWHHSPALREKTGPILSENEKRKLSVLIRDLSGEACWGRVRREMQALRQEYPTGSLLSRLKTQYPLSEAVPSILADNSRVAQALRQLRVPGTIWESDGHLRKRFDRICLDLQAPWCRPFARELENQICETVAALGTAGEQGDMATFRWAVECLESGLDQHLSYGDGEKKSWDCRMAILRTYQGLYEMERQFEANTRRLKELKEKQAAIVAHIQQRRSQGILNQRAMDKLEFSGEDMELSARMNEAVILSNQIENLARENARKLELRVQYNATVENLKLTLSSIALKSPQEVEQVLRDAQRWLAEEMVQGNRELDQLEDMNKTVGFVIQEGTGHIDVENIVAAYDRLLDETQPSREGANILC